MNTALMSDSYWNPGCDAAFDWCLPPAAAESLATGSAGCYVRVEDGAVWLTQSLDATAIERGAVPDDLWLGAGESLWLPPGTRWVLQAWPSARMRLLQAPPRRLGADRRGGSPLRQHLYAWLARLRRSVPPVSAPV